MKATMVAHYSDVLGFRSENAQDRFDRPQRLACGECGGLLGWFYDKQQYESAKSCGYCNPCIIKADAKVRRLIVRIAEIVKSLANDWGKDRLVATTGLTRKSVDLVIRSSRGSIEPRSVHVNAATGLGLHVLASNIKRYWKIAKSRTENEGGKWAKKD